MKADSFSKKKKKILRINLSVLSVAENDIYTNKNEKENPEPYETMQYVQLHLAVIQTSSYEKCILAYTCVHNPSNDCHHII